MAVDEVELFECAKPQPEENCLPEEYHCQYTRACVSRDMLCDFADDCGDQSDEDMETQGCDQYTRINFEDPLNPWGSSTRPRPRRGSNGSEATGAS